MFGAYLHKVDNYCACVAISIYSPGGKHDHSSPMQYSVPHPTPAKDWPDIQCSVRVDCYGKWHKYQCIWTMTIPQQLTTRGKVQTGISGLRNYKAIRTFFNWNFESFIIAILWVHWLHRASTGLPVCSLNRTTFSPTFWTKQNFHIMPHYTILKIWDVLGFILILSILFRHQSTNKDRRTEGQEVSAV